MKITVPVRLALPAAAWAAMAAFVSLQPDRDAAVESRFLSLLAVAVLFAVALLPRRDGLTLAVAAVAAAAVVWAVPAGPTRGAALVVVLAAALAWEGVLAPGALEATRRWGPAVALALGAQALARSELLLVPELDPRTLVVLLALPLAGGLATAALYNVAGPGALVAAGLLVALGPGFRVAPTLALVGLAAAVVGGRPRGGESESGDRGRDATNPGESAGGEGGHGDSVRGSSGGLPEGSSTARAAAATAVRRSAWVVAAVVIAAAAVWRPAFAVVLAAGMALVASTSRAAFARAPLKRWVPMAVAIAAPVAALAPGAAAGWSDAAAQLAWLPLLLPALPFALRRRPIEIGAAVLLAAAALRWLPAPEALPVPLALAALALPRRGEVASLQRLWTALLAVAALVLAAYPWLRHRPLESILPRLGLGDGWLDALTLAAALAGLAWAGRWIASRRPGGAHTATLALAAIGLGALAALPGRPALPLAGEVVTLGPDRAAIELMVDPPLAARRLVVDSYLSNGHQLEPGTPVARVRLDGPGGTRTWTLTAGHDTGEWAARRADVAATPGLATPPAWLSWVAPPGFFAQRYRATRPIEPPLAAGRVTIQLAAELPDAVRLALFHLELRP